MGYPLYPQDRARGRLRLVTAVWLPIRDTTGPSLEEPEVVWQRVT